MKTTFLALVLALAGCRSTAPVSTLPASTPAPAVGRATPPTPEHPAPLPAITTPDPGNRQQTQLIEALINQNEALTARLAEMQTAPQSPPIIRESVSVADLQSTALPDTPSITTSGALDSTIAPNGDGVIDLAVIEQASASDEPVNPFAVRTTSGEKTREFGLLIGGIVLGPSPCALVNERLVQPGDRIERFVVEQIEAGAVVVRYGEHRLRLPVSAIPTRVKLAL